MKDPRDESQEALLRKVALGEIPASAPEVRAAADSSPEFESALGRIVSTLEGLTAARSHRDSVLEESARLVGSEFDASIERSVASEFERLDRERNEPRPMNRPWRRYAAAAAILVMALGGWWFYGSRRSPVLQSPTYLGGEIECVEPVGTVPEFRGFTWRGSPPAGCWYEVSIRDPSGREVAHSAHLTVPAYEPTPEVIAKLPSEIEWTVLLKDGGGTRGTGTARASRSH